MSLFNFLKKQRTDFNDSSNPNERFILCIDGGGMRGIIPVLVLQRLEKHIRQLGGEKTIQSYFDLIAGTSTGGLISLSLTCPSELESKQCQNGKQVDLEALGDLYMTVGKEIFPSFPPDIFGIGKIVRQVAFDKYPCFGIEGALQRWFKNTKLSEASVPTLITSYNISLGHEQLLKSYVDDGFLAWEAGRATSAAPTYFAPFEKDGFLLADGGVIANNPSLFAYVEAKKLYKDCTCFNILSLGTANDVHKTKDDEASGLLNWIDQVAPMYSTAQRRTVDYLMEDSGIANYLRVNGDMGLSIKMDDIREESMNRLYAYGCSLVCQYDEKLQKFAQLLVRSQHEANC